MSSERVLHILYQDGSGGVEPRRIVCREVYEAEGRVYLDAFCFNARDDRNFRRDRVQFVIDEETGEEFDFVEEVLPITSRRAFAPGRNAAREAAVGAVRLLRWCLQSEGLRRDDLEAAVSVVLAGAQKSDFDQVEAAASGSVTGLADITKAAVAVANMSDDDLLSVLQFCVERAGVRRNLGERELKLLQRAARLAGLPVEIG